MSAIPTKGIHVQSAMRWLFETLLGNARHVVPFEYNHDPYHFGGGSENMKLLYCAVGYIANHTAGRERLINWYASERGHGGGEPLTVSHCQLHLGGHSAIALHAHRSNDSEILSLALNWLSIEYFLYSLCEVDGEPWTPGARGVLKGKIVGENPTRGKWLRAVREDKYAPKLNQYDLGACCIVKLSEDARKDIASQTGKGPITIQGDLSIARRYGTHGSFSAVFATLPLKGGGVQAAGLDKEGKWIYRDARDPEVQSRITNNQSAITFSTPP